MENQKHNSSDEIDLGAVMARIGNFFHDLWFNFLRFLALVRRIPLENRMSFSLIIVASLVIGFLYSKYLQKNFYETTMILSSEYFNKRLVESSIDKLNLLADEQNKKGLARVLNLPDTVANKIVEFSATPFIAEDDIVELEVLKEQLRNAQLNAKNEQIINQVVARIEIENRHAFQISVRTLNPTVITNLETALVAFFRETNFVRKRIEITHNNLVERKLKLEQDLQKLDSLKVAINQTYKTLASQSRQGSNNVILSDEPMTDPVDIYTQDEVIYGQLQATKKALYLQPDFEVVDGFTEFSEPANPGLARMLLYSVLVGIVIAYLEVALRSFNRYLSKLD
jgi:hypothetical protein